MLHKINDRIKILIILIFILCSILLVRLFYLQIIYHKHYYQLEKQNYESLHIIPSTRGLIYDRHGNILADNKVVYNLVAIPNLMQNKHQELLKLARLFSWSDKKTKNLFYHLTSNKQITLVLQLKQQQLNAFTHNSYKFPGITLKPMLIRYYPYNEFTHIIGYVARISKQQKIAKTHNLFTGKTGIERAYNKLLTGSIGIQKIQTNDKNLIQKQLIKRQVKNGNNLYLTIDMKLQLKIVKILGNKVGAVIVMKTDTGDILAMVSNPSFDANIFTQISIPASKYKKLLDQDNHPLYNRATTGLYAPGSTVKPFLALAALTDNIITANTTIYDPGYYHLPNNKHIYHDWKTRGHGQVNVTKAIIKSCDTFFYHLGYKMGITKISQALKSFGFGKSVALDFYPLKTGIAPSPQWKQQTLHHPWYLGDTINTSIGQGYVTVTPLQLAIATTTLSRKGSEIAPRLLLATQAANNKKIVYTKIKEAKQVFQSDAKNWQLIINAMDKVISQHGTGWGFGIPKNYTAAGKTGTAQVSSIRFSENYTKVPYKLRPNSWIILFAPVKKPQITIVVLVEHQPGGAAPIARKIADYILSHQN